MSSASSVVDLRGVSHFFFELSYANKNSFVRNSLIVSLNLAAGALVHFVHPWRDIAILSPGDYLKR